VFTWGKSRDRFERVRRSERPARPAP
jgi:hypothetical protein